MTTTVPWSTGSGIKLKPAPVSLINSSPHAYLENNPDHNHYVPYGQKPGPGQLQDRKPLPDSATPSIYQKSPPYKGPTSSTPPPVSNPTVSIPTGETPTQTPPWHSGSVYSIQNQVQPQIHTLSTSPTGQFSVTSNDMSANANPFAASSSVQTSSTQPKAISASPSFKTKPAKPKPKSATDKYLGKDADYQSTLRDLARALTDFKARQNVERTRAGTEYGYAKRMAGLQRTQDLQDIADDFAARGIIRSGVYGTRLGNYNTQYNEKTAELGRQYNNQLGDFATQLRDFVRNQALQKEAAREAAIRRRAAQLGKIQ